MGVSVVHHRRDIFHGHAFLSEVFCLLHIDGSTLSVLKDHIDEIALLGRLLAGRFERKLGLGAKPCAKVLCTVSWFMKFYALHDRP